MAVLIVLARVSRGNWVSRGNLLGSHPDLCWRPLLGPVQDSQHLHFIVDFVNGNEGERHEHELAGAFDAAKPSTVRKGVERSDAFNHCLGYPAGSVGAGLSDVVKCARDRRPRPSSIGRALAAIALVHPRGDFVVVQEPAFASGDAALLDFPTEPIVMLDRVGQKIQRDLIGVASGLGGESIQLGFKFWRNMQVHKPA